MFLLLRQKNVYIFILVNNPFKYRYREAWTKWNFEDGSLLEANSKMWTKSWEQHSKNICDWAYKVFRAKRSTLRKKISICYKYWNNKTFLSREKSVQNSLSPAIMCALNPVIAICSTLFIHNNDNNNTCNKLENTGMNTGQQIKI